MGRVLFRHGFVLQFFEVSQGGERVVEEFLSGRPFSVSLHCVSMDSHLSADGSPLSSSLMTKSIFRISMILNLLPGMRSPLSVVGIVLFYQLRRGERVAVGVP